MVTSIGMSAPVIQTPMEAVSAPPTPVVTPLMPKVAGFVSVPASPVSSTRPVPCPAGHDVAYPLPSAPGAHEPDVAADPATYEPSGNVAGSVIVKDLVEVVPRTAATLASQVPLSPGAGALSAKCRVRLVGWAAAVVPWVGAAASKVPTSKVVQNAPEQPSCGAASAEGWLSIAATRASAATVVARLTSRFMGAPSRFPDCSTTRCSVRHARSSPPSLRPRIEAVRRTAAASPPASPSAYVSATPATG